MFDGAEEDLGPFPELTRLGRRVRRLVWLAGLSWLLLLFCGGSLLLGGLDWLIHLDDPGLRCLAAIALVAGGTWVLWRWLWLPLSMPLDPAQLAVHFERQSPRFQGQLVSAVQFARTTAESSEHSERVGSVVLQQQVMAQAAEMLREFSTHDVLRPGPVRRLALVSGGVLLLTMLVAAGFPGESRIAATRLWFPWTTAPWPKQTQLRFLDAEGVEKDWQAHPLISRGEPLELLVDNRRGRLPEKVWLEWKTEESGIVQREPFRRTTLLIGDRPREAALATVMPLKPQLWVRAVGGDDDTMPFSALTAVVPPSLESLQVTITRPGYLGGETEVLPYGVGHVQGVVGSRVKIVARANQPLQGAKLRIRNDAPLEVTLADEGRELQGEFVIREAGLGTYWLEIRDQQGFEEREPPRFELRGIPDTLPELTLDDPAADVLLTPTATLPVRGGARDDFGLTAIRLWYQSTETPATIPLFELPTRADASANAVIDPSVADESTTSASSTAQRPQVPPVLERSVEYVWQIADLKPTLGQKIPFRLEGLDAYDLGLPHIGKSQTRTITIVSDDEKRSELSGRISELADTLRELTVQQDQLRTQATELKTQLDAVGELRPSDMDLLRRLEMDQRQAASRLANPTSGLVNTAEQILREGAANQVADPEVQRRLGTMIEELERLRDGPLSEIERGLVDLQKRALQPRDGREEPSPARPNGSRPNPESPASDQQASKSNDPAGDPSATIPRDQSPKNQPSLSEDLAGIVQQQTGVGDTLHELESLLTEWQDRRDITRDLQRLSTVQEELNRDTEQLGQATLSKSAGELTPQEKAELGKLSTRQKQIADQLQQFEKRLDGVADRLEEQRDADGAETFREARDELSQKGTSGRLREAAARLQDNKISSARQAQRQAREQLEEMLQLIKQRRTTDTEQFVKQLEAAEELVDQLQKEEEAIVDALQEAEQMAESPEKTEALERLAVRQQQVRAQVAELERQLKRLRLRESRDDAAAASARMGDAAQQLRLGDEEAAQRSAEEVLDDLQQLQADLQEERKEAQEQLEFEQNQKLADQLTAIRGREQALLDEILRLQEEQQQRGQLTRGQLKTLLTLADTQRDVREEVATLQKEIKVAEAFVLALREVTRQMERTNERLAERQLDEGTVRYARGAVREIDRLLTVLQPPKEKPVPQKPRSDGQPPPGGNEEQKPRNARPPGGSISLIQQLTLLKDLQQSVLDRTHELDQLRAATPTGTEADRRERAAADQERAELAALQAELSKLTRNLTAELGGREEEDAPAKKPATMPTGEEASKTEESATKDDAKPAPSGKSNDDQSDEKSSGEESP